MAAVIILTAGAAAPAMSAGVAVAASAGTATATAAATTATISATNASMNGEGDFLNQIKDTTKTTWDATTDSDAIESYAIAGVTAALTGGLGYGLDSATNTATTATTATQANGIISAGNQVGASFGARATSALAQSAISTTTNTAVQAAVNNEDFKDALRSQITNIIIGAVGNVAANQIGSLAHSPKLDANGNILRDASNNIIYEIGKPTQLALHAALGCGMGAAGGGDCASGALSGVTGELMAEFADQKLNLNEAQIKEFAGLTGGLSAIVTGNAVGLSDKEIADNMFSGSRIAKNAAENNYLMPQEKAALVRELDACGGDEKCQNNVQARYEVISQPRDEMFTALYDDCKGGDSVACGGLESLHYDLRTKLTLEGNEYFWKHFGEFELLPDYQSIFHTFIRESEGSVNTFGENKNLKFIHPILGYEVVIDQNNKIVTDPLNIGTYNFYNPNGFQGLDLIGSFGLHGALDVSPYEILGNSKYDPTKNYQRKLPIRGIETINQIFRNATQ